MPLQWDPRLTPFPSSFILRDLAMGIISSKPIPFVLTFDEKKNMFSTILLLTELLMAQIASVLFLWPITEAGAVSCTKLGPFFFFEICGSSACTLASEDQLCRPQPKAYCIKALCMSDRSVETQLEDPSRCQSI
ncbi:hypothetical protein ASPZODRAFT_801385 [Penicilliopsis zonata CBS 506.65]|uniref:Uncharacterized protein n=1 Tax=Penicilliopsis zonata CBS 506.65 TaxID=1073090 RepID=A0A1L9S9X9_9EURO|nr:hypothetical protein ASPZODRAFT_801385 [Penicilliopsis zonata CBS 506.65]OJJ43958.1 hypothetical protein ASPZODRAFT_801385 [Penicilliopsis zonata CBS 506.65]